MTNPYFFDLLFLALLIGMFGYGKRKGAFKVIAGMFGTLAAWIGTLILRPRFLPIVTSLLKPLASKAVIKAAEAAGVMPLIDAVLDLSLEENLTAMTALAEKLNISTALLDRLLLPTEAARPLDLLTDALMAKAAPILTFLVLFFGLKIAIQLAVSILSLDWPIIRTVNRLAGGAIGLCGGLVLVVVLFFGILVYGSPEATGITSRLLLSRSLTGSLIATLFV